MPFLSNSFYRPIIGCTVAIVSALTLSACQPEKQQTITLQGETMGTTYTVKYLSDDQDKLPSPAEIQKRIDDALKEVNRQMSTYQTDSEISQFNQLRTVNQAMPISQDFAYVTGEALRLNKLTHGALDVTVGPLVNLWGSARKKKSHTNRLHKKSNMLQKWSVRTNSNFPKMSAAYTRQNPSRSLFRPILHRQRIRRG